mgnify:FL=1|uniref:YkgJ family cysteine cluster protein n=1 Tax=Candidatus Stercorousia sp. TaxID=3048886 RepID=UPI00402538E9
MVSYEENFLAKRPQHLCHMCGKCCRVVSPSVPYEELKKMAENGDSGAVDFFSLFVPYESIEEARKVDASIVDNIIHHKMEDGIYNEAETTFYYCKYLQDNNLCSRYESRLTLCKHCPSSPWVIVPPGCGFEGWLFWQREEIKQKVRRYKEELLELALLRKKTKDTETVNKILAVEQKIKKNIDMYKKYGSENW